jgi:hypothetical protein
VSEGASNVRFVFDGEPPPIPDDGVPLHAEPDDVGAHLSDLELVSDIWAADARESRHVAERAEAIAALARRRSAERDRAFGPLGKPGLDSQLRQPEALRDVSETFVTELAMIRSCSEMAAEALAVESILLTTKLRATWSALYEGRIDPRRMRALVDLLGPAKPKVAAEVERRVLPGAGDLTVAQLRARVRRLLFRLDAKALEDRRVRAAKKADVFHQPTGDGMSDFIVRMPVWKAAACVDAVRQYADMARAAGDRRPIGVIRAETAADFLLRPWDKSRPPVTALLTILAPHAALHPAQPGAPEPPAAEVNGEIVTAAQCRELLEELDMLGVRSAPAGGCVQVAIGDPSTGRLVTVATRSELRRGAGTGRRRRRRTGTSRRSGPNSTDTATDDGPGLGPPAATSAYSPTAAQKRFIRVRDRTCRMPGCRRAPGRCDIDHAVAHADGGPTDCWNLCCLCRRHHRIKTFARDWFFQLLADGSLVVRTPSGVSRITRPPGWCDEAEPDPPWLEEQAPPDVLRC